MKTKWCHKAPFCLFLMPVAFAEFYQYAYCYMKDTIQKVVTIGGGSGGFTILRGLREYPIDITAVCTVFDSGGSTGVLRDAYGALPQGDLRRCLLALIPESGADWRKLVMHRFEKNESGLSDHSLGNLMLLGAEKEWGRLEGILRIANLMKIRGTVLPVSIDDAHLMAELSDGEVIRTESSIDTRNVLSDERSINKVWLDRPTTACKEVINAIHNADVVVLGPGDLYTSIIPNLLVNGVAEAINSSSAKLVYVGNIMTKGAETRGFKVEDFIDALRENGIARKFDVVVVNNGRVSETLCNKYWDEERAEPVKLAKAYKDKLSSEGVDVRGIDVLSQVGASKNLIRHSSKRLARELMDIIEKGKNK